MLSAATVGAVAFRVAVTVRRHVYRVNEQGVLPVFLRRSHEVATHGGVCHCVPPATNMAQITDIGIAKPPISHVRRGSIAEHAELSSRAYVYIAAFLIVCAWRQRKVALDN